MEISENNLSNVFNLEGEDFSNRFKKKTRVTQAKV